MPASALFSRKVILPCYGEPFTGWHHTARSLPGPGLRKLLPQVVLWEGSAGRLRGADFTPVRKVAPLTPEAAAVGAGKARALFILTAQRASSLGVGFAEATGGFLM